MATPRPSRNTSSKTLRIDGKPLAARQADVEALDRLKAEIKYLSDQNRLLHRALAAKATPPRILRAVPARRAKASRHADRIRAIIADTHGSAMDPIAAGVVIADFKQLQPREIVHLGDGVDCGGFLAQHHTLGYVAETEYCYDDDIATANGFLDDLQNACTPEEFDWIEGNHERRVETWCVTQTLRHRRDCERLRQAFAPEFLLHLKSRGIRYYRQGEFYGCRTPGTIRKGKCYFWHGSSTARHAATVNLSAIGGNVVFGHTHRQQGDSAVPVAQGDIGAWNPGCLCRQQPLWNHTRPSQWTIGYAIQIVSPTGNFLHINVRIVNGKSLLTPLLHLKP